MHSRVNGIAHHYWPWAVIFLFYRREGDFPPWGQGLSKGDLGGKGLRPWSKEAGDVWVSGRLDGHSDVCLFEQMDGNYPLCSLFRPLPKRMQNVLHRIAYHRNDNT